MTRNDFRMTYGLRSGPRYQIEGSSFGGAAVTVGPIAATRAT